MKVILNRDIKNIGRKGEVKDVPDGHARNLLIPQGAVRAVDTKGAQSAQKQHEREKAQKDEREQALIAKLKNISDKGSITISAKANEQGHLFVGIHEKDIFEALAKHGIKENTNVTINIPAAIKELGEHVIAVKVGKWQGEFVLRVLGL